MCNLGEILELEAIKSERVRNIKIPEDEVLELELEDVFNNDLKNKN